MRPEGWDKRTRYGITVNNIDLDEIFEAGADAMLEGLRKIGEKMGDDGYLVFIPEDKE